MRGWNRDKYEINVHKNCSKLSKDYITLHIKAELHYEDYESHSWTVVSWFFVLSKTSTYGSKPSYMDKANHKTVEETNFD